MSKHFNWEDCARVEKIRRKATRTEQKNERVNDKKRRLKDERRKNS